MTNNLLSNGDAVWRKIKTAPKGEDILLLSNSKEVCMGRWERPMYSTKPRWKWHRVMEWGGPDGTEDMFTHWMPLPSTHCNQMPVTNIEQGDEVWTA